MRKIGLIIGLTARAEPALASDLATIKRGRLEPTPVKGKLGTIDLKSRSRTTARTPTFVSAVGRADDGYVLEFRNSDAGKVMFDGNADATSRTRCCSTPMQVGKRAI
jgi:hypothetical protein